MSDYIEVEIHEYEAVEALCIKTILTSAGFDLNKPMLYYDDILRNSRVYRQQNFKEDKQ